MSTPQNPASAPSRGGGPPGSLWRTFATDSLLFALADYPAQAFAALNELTTDQLKLVAKAAGQVKMFAADLIGERS